MWKLEAFEMSSLIDSIILRRKRADLESRLTQNTDVNATIGHK